MLTLCPDLLTDIASNLLYVIKGVELNQPRLLQRAIRQNYSIRRNADRDLLSRTVHAYIPTDAPVHDLMLEFISLLPAVEEQAGGDAMDAEESAQPTVLSVLPEVEVYVFTLIVTTLLRAALDEAAARASEVLVVRLRGLNRRSLDLLSSKAYFYFALAHERIHRLEHIRPVLLTLYRTACVRHDEMGQAVLLNTLLRWYPPPLYPYDIPMISLIYPSYILFNPYLTPLTPLYSLLSADLVDAAHVLSLRVSFPESASNNQFCRYLFYLGRIQAVQLQYSEAYQRLTMAARKAPIYAAGFGRMVTKLTILVQLLMGDIPERAVFASSPSLGAYLALTTAVRTGDVRAFDGVLERYGDVFKSDANYSLVQRLGHNVLKTGLRKVSVSYSRVSLQEVASKLHLPSASAAEYICAKAIRDGVIEAKIDHANGWMTCQEVVDLYSTEEPQRAFHKRIAFCLDVHNDAVKSMRYPPEDSYPKKKGLFGDKDKDGKDEKTIDELLKELDDEDFDDDVA